MDAAGDAEPELPRGSGVSPPRARSGSPTPRTPRASEVDVEESGDDGGEKASCEKRSEKKLPSLAEKIENLKKQQAEQKLERRKVAQELKNAQRKRRRLKERARGLSDADLATVIALRASEADRAAGRHASNPAPAAESGTTRAHPPAAAGA